MDIQSVINSITTAEMEAEEIVRLAGLKAKDVKLAAESSAERIKKESSAKTKQAVKLINGNAEVAANTKCGEKVRQGAKKADELALSVSVASDKAVELVVGRLIAKYVDS